MKKDEILAKVYAEFRKGRLIDDLVFRKLCENKDAIEEILRVILKKPKLAVLEAITQKSENEPIFHGVVLDCICKLDTGEIVDVEVQVAQSDDLLKRMRYYGSILTVENSPKAKRFAYNEIPKVILIMLCDFDIYRLGFPIYEIERRVAGTDIISDNGQREIYVNLTADVKENDLSDLFKIFNLSEYLNEQSFPNLSKEKERIKNLQLGGEQNMSGVALEIFNDGVEEGIAKGSLEFAINMIKRGILTVEEAAKELKMSEIELKKLMKT